MEGKERADIVIVTKCPSNLKPMEFRVMSKMLSLRPYQKLYYTTLEYEPLYPLYGGDKIALDALAPETNVLLLTGIASPRQMELALQPRCASITPLTFGDHHQFKPCDIEELNTLFASLPEPRMVVTTEKDSARLVDVNGLSDEVRNNTYVLPVRVDFLQNGAEAFNKQILSYIKKNSKSSILLKGKEDVKPKEKKSSEKRNTIKFK
jgi:tetraacyldisaccharide 4'-kinase